MQPPSSATWTEVAGSEFADLVDGWQLAATGPDAAATPAEVRGVDWRPAVVPGTVAAAAASPAGPPAADVEASDWWFRTTFETEPAAAGEELVLHLDGIATIHEVYLNGRRVAAGESMFERHAVRVTEDVRERNELAIVCRALGPRLGVSRRPRPRWRTRLVPDNNLRWFRTTLIGRIPGFAPGPPAVGPWRPVRLERRRAVALDALELSTRLDGTVGIVAVRARLRSLDGRPIRGLEVDVAGPAGSGRATLEAEAGPGTPDDGGSVFEGVVRVPDAVPWWPHSHGDQALSTVTLSALGGDGPVVVARRTTGFRTLAAGPTPEHEIERDGLFVHVNGEPVFARGALWTPLDPVGLGATREQLRTALEQVRRAGMNMLRVPGYWAYETDAFHELCDELGILVWQDLMFASMDYPFADADFARLVEAEVADQAARLAGHPSVVVVCGSEEVHQQIAMLGLDLELVRIPFYDETVPAICRARGLDAIHVPSTPSGGPLPLRPDRGVTNYYGVGGYRGPLSDARTSGVRFAGECLAFANVPTEEALATLIPEPPTEAFIHHPRWKAGVPRDAGSAWDFDDVRDDYLAMVFGIEPRTIRRDDHDRYLELSRALTGEVMAHVFGEWRRAGSPSGGGLILWLRDLLPGAGWGVIDNEGRPKTVYHHLRRILAPTAVWLVDEGIGGVVAHVAHERPEPFAGRLRIALYTDLETPIGEATEILRLTGRGALQRDVEAMLGHFVDAAWAYRFGPPAQDAIVASLELERADGWGLVSQAFHFPAGRPFAREAADRLGLSAVAAPGDEPDSTVVSISSRRLAYGVRLHVPGFEPSDDAFSIEPGRTRTIALRPAEPGQAFGGGAMTALNLAGRVGIRVGG